MHQYRVTKYDPQYRQNGVYTKEEWTDFSDVGRTFGGVPLTLQEYERVEQQHIDFLAELVNREAALPLTIDSLEINGNDCRWQNGQQISRAELPVLLREILRCSCWCRLTSKDFFIHFGYDYYMYVGCTHTPEGMYALAMEYALFAEPMISPYHEEPDVPVVQPDLRPMTAIYLTRGDQLLLLYRKGSRVVGNSYTGTAGGHMEAEEFNSARACVLRELEEETGLTEAALEGLTMRYVTLRLKCGEIRENYYFFAALREGFEPTASNEGDLTWCRLADLDALPMPVTAKHVLRHYVVQGRFDQILYGGVTTPEGTVFTPMKEF